MTTLMTGLPPLRPRPWRRSDRVALLRHANDRAVRRNLAAS
jgi:hypothetical protein